MTGGPLSQTYVRIALRRARTRWLSIAPAHALVLDRGMPAPGYLCDTVRALLDEGALLTLALADEYGSRRITLTTAGEALLADFTGPGGNEHPS